MARPTNREDFKDYCLRSLGEPVIKVNIDEDQLDDRLDDALEMYQNFHFDAVERIYLKHQLTAGDVANTYVTMPEATISVSRVFPLSTGLHSTNMFDMTYQWKLNDIQSFTSPFLIDYYLSQRHLRLLDQTFNGEIGIRHSRHARRVYIDVDWINKAVAGQWLIFDTNSILDPDTYTKIWNDDWLKRYATQLIKRQWGTNLTKFSGKLIGDITVNGDKIYLDAVTEIKALEVELREKFEMPPFFITG
jgi:hypothetical protein